ncbi:MAG: SH3 domain-containing protein [Acidobacteriota bacterium]|nr:SH3 domain-containing protein [Acidobacteriota bacterium]
MPNAKDMLWFKQTFHDKIETAIQGTPFSLNMLTALACQETGEIWPTLRKLPLSVDRILELCVGDTIDATATGGRSAFPKTRAHLEAKPNGQRMFQLARQALVDMAHYINQYKGPAANPNKFCHGFGIFQYDLQFFVDEPDYFLEKRYADFDICLQKAIGELRHALKKIGFDHKTTLTDQEMTYVAIAYNTGGFKPAKGLKQGYFNGSKYYGEQIYDYLMLSKTVQVGATGPGPVQPPAPAVTGTQYKVEVSSTPLNLRNEPRIDPANPTGNVKAKLPDGQIVRAITNQNVNGFLEVETDLQGMHYRGFASASYLKPV